MALAPHERIIFPLDFATVKEALKFAILLKDRVGVFKIGLELFVSIGPKIIKDIKKIAPKTKIFLDLKFHDIPETVKRAAQSAQRLGVDFITVHIAEGRELLKASVEPASSANLDIETLNVTEAVPSKAVLGAGRVKILGVTVLTSLSQEDLLAIGMARKLSNPLTLVLHRARIAKLLGLSGVVCSGLEAKSVKQTLGKDFLVVTPGIRLEHETIKRDDQKRTVTPYSAILNGADYLVIGRPIRDAVNPVKVIDMIVKDIVSAEKAR